MKSMTAPLEWRAPSVQREKTIAASRSLPKRAEQVERIVLVKSFHAASSPAGAAAPVAR